jgi:hypothetical protein
MMLCSVGVVYRKSLSGQADVISYIEIDVEVARQTANLVWDSAEGFAHVGICAGARVGWVGQRRVRG